MLSVKKYCLFLAAIIVTLSSCGSNGDKTKENNSKKDSDTVKTVVLEETNADKKIAGSYDRLYNDIARYLGGMKAETGCKLDASYTQNKDWEQYAATSEKRWHEYDSTRIQVLRKWSASELTDINKTGKTLFYPFSGPDILHGNCFFNNADTTVMIGLEPVGSVPFLEKNNEDTISLYFRSVNTSLSSVLRFSFFRTIAMKKDLRSEVSGTIPVMMIFLEHTGNRVLNVQPLHIDSTGKRVYNEKGHGGFKMPGVEITYCREDSTHLSHLFFYSCDISNEGMLKTLTPFKTYLTSLGKVNTYLKSASYLMYKDFFSEIRNIILTQSDNVLQDDSGIPHRFFDPGIWSYTLYGHYTGVIPLFKGDEQHDLDSIFKNAKDRKDLEFGIGYKWQKGTSNLVLYKKTDLSKKSSI